MHKKVGRIYEGSFWWKDSTRNCFISYIRGGGGGARGEANDRGGRDLTT